MDNSSISFLRPLAVFAGIIGIVQSLAWIGLSITSIVAYYCNMDFTGTTATMGSLEGLAVFQMYFHGSCIQPELPAVNWAALQALNLMRPVDIHAWAWVYLMISFFWLISSATMLSHVKSQFIQWVNIFLYFWIAITLAVSVVDLALGILFGVDYDRVMSQSNLEPIVPPVGAPLQDSPPFLLLAAQSGIGMLFTIVLRGYLLWILNVVLAVYFFTQTLRISEYNRLTPKAVGVSNPGYVDDARRNHPIEAYGSKGHQPNLWYAPPVPVQQPQPSQLSQQRAENDRTRTLYDERKQFYQNSQSLPRDQMIRQPLSVPPPPQQAPSPPIRTANDVQLRQSNVVRELTHRNSYLATKPTGFNLPDPDYSPPMPRANPFDNRPQLRSALRSSRF